MHGQEVLGLDLAQLILQVSPVCQHSHGCGESLGARAGLMKPIRWFC